MLGFPNNSGNAGYKGFKPMNAAGKIEYPETKEPKRRFNLFGNASGSWRFLSVPEDTVLDLATFYTEDAALRVYDYLAKGGLLDAKV